MNFNSRISTSAEQSKRLLALGIDPLTADMSLCAEEDGTMQPSLCAYNSYHEQDRQSGNALPSWSLSRLLEMMPKAIEQMNRPNADLDINGDGMYWFVTYEEFGYDVVHQEMKGDLFDAVIGMISWLIQNNFFNKKYLKRNNELIKTT